LLRWGKKLRNKKKKKRPHDLVVKYRPTFPQLINPRKKRSLILKRGKLLQQEGKGNLREMKNHQNSIIRFWLYTPVSRDMERRVERRGGGDPPHV